MAKRYYFNILNERKGDCPVCGLKYKECPVTFGLDYHEEIMLPFWGSEYENFKFDPNDKWNDDWRQAFNGTGIGIRFLKEGDAVAVKAHGIEIGVKKIKNGVPVLTKSKNYEYWYNYISKSMFFDSNKEKIGAHFKGDGESYCLVEDSGWCFVLKYSSERFDYDKYGSGTNETVKQLWCGEKKPTIFEENGKVVFFDEYGLPIIDPFEFTEKRGEKMNTIIKNCTPHTIGIEIDGKIETFEPCGIVPRIGTIETAGEPIAGIPTIKRELGAPELVPDPEPNTIFIVSAMVGAAIADRPDIFMPDTGATAIRENGQIVAVKRLVRCC